MNALSCLCVVSTIALFAAHSDPSQGAVGAAPVDATAPTRAVLITGASSGIGRRTAELLSQSGFLVYAGARKAADLAELDALTNVESVRLDVTKQEEIDAAVAWVKEQGHGLFGLINNAGVVVMGPMIEMSDEDLAFQMDVNVNGPFAVTKAFAPLLIEGGGRISTTGSISGVVTWGMGGAYCMSKHAVEAYTEVLADELEPLGVRVSVVEPGNYKSKIAKSMGDRLEDRGYTAKGSRYEEAMRRVTSGNLDRGQYDEPDDVAQCFLRFLTEEKTQRHYMVVPNAGEATRTIQVAISRVVELNRGQPFEFDRDELVEMLDAALSAASK